MSVISRVAAPSSPQAQKRMRACRSQETAPERALRSALFRMGFRYRIHRRPVESLRRKADVVFPRWRVAVFIDGCFWHGCPRHATWPKANAAFWRAKILGNRKRDRDTDRKLAKSGWLVVRVWEHEDSRAAADRVAKALRSRQAVRS